MDREARSASKGRRLHRAPSADAVHPASVGFKSWSNARSHRRKGVYRRKPARNRLALLLWLRACNPLNWECAWAAGSLEVARPDEFVDNRVSATEAHYAVICLQISMSVSKTTQRRGTIGQVLRLAEKQPILRARDVAHQGIHTSTLTRMTRSGALERVGPGRYQLPRRTRRTEHHDLAVATAAVPRSVVCLVSALRFHDLGTQLPAEVWIAVPRGTRVPRVSAPIRVVNISPPVFDLGIEEHRIEGQSVRIYSVARTVADCFRFRNKVGLDVALEALTDAWRSKRLSLDDLNRIAKKLRVQRVMQPYLETVVM